jgi:hypothetical protein
LSHHHFTPIPAFNPSPIYDTYLVCLSYPSYPPRSTELLVRSPTVSSKLTCCLCADIVQKLASCSASLSHFAPCAGLGRTKDKSLTNHPRSCQLSTLFFEQGLLGTSALRRKPMLKQRLPIPSHVCQDSLSRTPSK